MRYLPGLHFFKKLAVVIILCGAANQIVYSQEMTSPDTSPVNAASSVSASQPANGAVTQSNNLPAANNAANSNAPALDANASPDQSGNAAQNIQNPLSGDRNETMTEAKDITDFINQALQCDQIRDRVVTYNVDFPGGGRIWIQASKTGFCRGAILPQPEGELAICDFTKEELSGLFTPEVIARIKNMGPNKDNLRGMEGVLNPIIDCYKKNKPSAKAKAAAATGVTTTTTIETGTTIQAPAEEKYDYSKKLQ